MVKFESIDIPISKSTLSNSADKLKNLQIDESHACHMPIPNYKSNFGSNLSSMHEFFIVISLNCQTKKVKIEIAKPL